MSELPEELRFKWQDFSLFVEGDPPPEATRKMMQILMEAAADQANALLSQRLGEVREVWKDGGEAIRQCSNWNEWDIELHGVGMKKTHRALLVCVREVKDGE